jgi:phosphoribosylamine--glycine ligase
VRLLLVGGGGREHALAWAIAQSPRVSAFYAAPGSPGIARHATCVPIAADALDDLVRFVDRERIDLTVVGPEVPLVAGLADRLTAAGHLVFGPSAAAARIEGSKAFAKDLMARYGVPTARFETFTDPAAARRFSRELGACVVKTDGLAAGKGAIVCPTFAEADAAIAQCLERGEFGASGRTVVVEEFMEGEEVSFFALVSGTHVLPLIEAQDHKTVFDGDRGPNTGGMGAFSPVASYDERTAARVMEAIIRPVAAALAAEGAPYHGVLYAGLMLTAEGPKVVEFNCRFGDPECQVLMVRLAEDLVPALLAVARHEALPRALAWTSDAAVCVNLVSGGYPGRYPTGIPITMPNDVERAADGAERDGVHVFHAGTASKDGRLVTAGGRVLSVTATAPSVSDAIARAYAAIERISFDGMHFRRDIGRRSTWGAASSGPPSPPALPAPAKPSPSASAV